MKRTALLLWGLFCATLAAQAQTPLRIVDATDQTPVAAASIFDARGNMVGFTLNDGTLSSIPDDSYPITIRSIGYELLTIAAPEEKDWLIFPTSYQLDAVVVIPAKCEVVKQTFYVREFISGGNSDTNRTAYKEYMTERFVPASQTSQYRESQKFEYPARVYTRVHSDGKDSLNYQSKSLKQLTVSKAGKGKSKQKSMKVPDSFLTADGSTTVTHEEMGKSGPTLFMKQKEGTLTVVRDVLSKKKNHVWSPWFLKVLGVTLTIQKCYATVNYRTNAEGVYTDKDQLDETIVMELTMEGKMVRKMTKSDEPVQMKAMMEAYLVENEYMTIQEAQTAISNRPEEIPIVVPERATPLNATTRQLIEEVMTYVANHPEQTE